MSGFSIETVHGAVTHPGRRRSINEDAYLAAAPFFLVADGLGGHHAGDVASAAVIDSFVALGASGTADARQLRHALDSARAAVARIGGARAAGSTLTGVAIAEIDGVGYWLAVNIGDSRTYRFSDGRLDQVTVDHSTVQELIEAGLVTPEQAATHRQRSEITRAIGAGTDSAPDFWLLPAQPGDRILVCSDGLSGEVSASEIRNVLATEPVPSVAAESLVRAALVAGGRDNITVLVVDALDVVGASADTDTAPSVHGQVGFDDAEDDTEDTLLRERVLA